MLQVARPLANETIEDAAIALLEAESVGGITDILLGTSLARSEAARGAVRDRGDLFGRSGGDFRSHAVDFAGHIHGGICAIEVFEPGGHFA